MASVTLKRGTRTEIENTQIQDGQLLIETDQLNNNRIYLDLPDGTRIPVGGGTSTAEDVSYENTQSHLTAENVQDAIDELSNIILDKLYPIGSIYLETTNTNPSSKLGGTWVAYGASDTYLRLGGNGSGGSNSVTLAANQIPTITTGNQSANHTHSYAHTHGTDSKGGHTHETGIRSINGTTTAYIANWANIASTVINTNTAGAHTHTTNSQSSTTTGNNSANHTHTYTNNNQQSVSIQPKYVSVYAWKRTA